MSHPDLDQLRVAAPPAAAEERESAGPRGGGELVAAVVRAARLLPQQGPITVFVHHNPLHVFEELPFAQAVERATELYGSESYMAEERYRSLLTAGRIRPEDLEFALAEGRTGEGDAPVLFGTSRHDLRLDLLRFPLYAGSTAEVRWLLLEGGALRRFRAEAPEAARLRSIEHTRRWLLRAGGDGDRRASAAAEAGLASLRTHSGDPEGWSDATWESATLELLWSTCLEGVRTGTAATEPGAPGAPESGPSAAQVDALVNGVLIPFCAAFLDQGFANWPLPERERGFLAAFQALYGEGWSWRSWLRRLPAELQRIAAAGMGAEEVLREALDLLEIEPHERERYLERALLALPGFAGMLWQLESNCEWAVHPAPQGTLGEYLAVRLVLERLALQELAARAGAAPGDLAGHARRARAPRRGPSGSREVRRAFAVFQLAQWRGWSPPELAALSATDWRALMRELDSFSSFERRHRYHLAYERKYRCQTLDAVLAHAARRGAALSAPGEVADYQVLTCIDEREESFRRHLEEADPSCETFGVAGFFGVAMYYRGATEAHFQPLCPVNVKPAHRVEEEPLYTFAESSQVRKRAQRRLGRMTHRIHLGSRSLVGGILTGLLGSLATFPLVVRVLFPRGIAMARKRLSRIVAPPATRLRLERHGDERQDGLLVGYSVSEMTDIVHAILTGMGLTRRLSKLVIVVGHGSSSLNNPHEAAHDCGACGGGRGGPNARAFAEMANDPRVRAGLAERGLVLPQDVFLLGAYHNTCDESVTYYDIDRLPVSHRALFARAKESIDEARRRNAHERCRRFESAGLGLTADEALQHVEGRAEDLSQTRPEYGHATNALAFVGRRAWSRGLYLDRRAFLTSYDPTQDDEESATLARLLGAVIPVCAGINLEYYFSFVDPTGYGCGTKLPHNITSLLGVMNGAASDLRTGLPWQMVEIHEPVRILFVIECTPAAMRRVLAGNPAIERLVRNEWVQLATLDPLEPRVHLYRRGEFEPYTPESGELPEFHSSLGWYRGQRDHLGFASIEDPAPSAGAEVTA